MPTRVTRRSFVKRSLANSATAALAAASAPTLLGADAAKTAVAERPAPNSKDTLPTGRIGKLQVSRLLLGGNLITHYTHSRDLRYVYHLAAQYNTREKIFETMACAEAHGINTLVIHTADGILDLLKEYRRQRGGKIQWIICPTAPIEPGLAAYREQVGQMIADGVDAIYVWGVRADSLVTSGKLDLLAEAVEVVRQAGRPSGVGAHELPVIAACEQHKVNADFYIKTLHHHNYPSAKLNYDSSWCANPEEVISLMQSVQKPWIAFKTMAAGAIEPADAFRYVIQGGADFVLAGMFDFEIADNVRTMKKVLGAQLKRSRGWLA